MAGPKPAQMKELSERAGAGLEAANAERVLPKHLAVKSAAGRPANAERIPLRKMFVMPAQARRRKSVKSSPVTGRTRAAGRAPFLAHSLPAADFRPERASPKKLILVCPYDLRGTHGYMFILQN